MIDSEVLLVFMKMKFRWTGVAEEAASEIRKMQQSASLAAKRLENPINLVWEVLSDSSALRVFTKYLVAR